MFSSPTVAHTIHNDRPSLFALLAPLAAKVHGTRTKYASKRGDAWQTATSMVSQDLSLQLGWREKYYR